ncbi:multiple epidermal growth factor-like domains protein 11 [Ostrea edulis]|uniref:multiple epidermal growth factor-like domains protein 11 n=1 Tax=Ostrea edulis TaxID=37623 RepID=UPI0024AFEFA1|nr:multiple epidermal growth factor-like domains protein 11 [Ostrea edulis]
MTVTIMVSIYLLLIFCVFSYAYENIALNKPAWQLHQYGEDAKSDASNAVDGLKSDLRAWGGQCIVSANYQQITTWRVDLEDILSIHHITIHYRTDNAAWGEENHYTRRFLGFSLYVSNTTDRTEGELCFHDTNYTRDTIPAILNVTCPVHGQYVIYYNERLPGVTYPDGYSAHAFNELCEVEVYGCPSSGFYGEGCSLPCPDINCRYCNIETGACQGCKPGYKGHRCEQECDAKKYGEGCQYECGKCKDMEQCHHKNGMCLKGCEPGFKEGKCVEQCDSRKYGVKCQQSCGYCLNFEQCHHINGTCLNGCDPGHQGLTCNETCRVGFYGMNCLKRCNKNCGIPERCNRTSGECEGGCQPRWRGLLCDTKCSDDLYGPDCNQTCGKCREGKPCHHFNGSCNDGCEPGYRGNKCDKECIDNLYGPDCKQACGECRDGKQCHHISGSCNDECEPGYRGNKCDEVCDFGHFGVSCREECSIFCQKSRDCHHVTGNCTGGCKSGWHGKDCLEVDNQVQKIMFYGVLGAFCVTLVLVAVLVCVLYNISKRHQVDRYFIKKYLASDTPSSRRTQDHGEEDLNSAYQELEVRGFSSSLYDSIY